jgi:hypothetical protein
MCWLGTAQAQSPAQTAAEIFADADLKLGQSLIEQNKCAACHARKVGGDGSAIFRPQGRISSPSFLRGMVEMCNTDLSLGLFPDEVNSIAAVLNRDHYKFK